MNTFVSEFMWFLMGDKDSIFSDAGILALIIYLEMLFLILKQVNTNLFSSNCGFFQIVFGYIQSFLSHKAHFIEIFLSGESRFSNDFKIRVQYNDGELLSFGFVIGAFVGSQL